MEAFGSASSFRKWAIGYDLGSQGKRVEKKRDAKFSGLQVIEMSRKGGIISQT